MIRNIHDLIGKKYPVMDIENNTYVAARTIKKVYDWENGAGIIISLRENPSTLLTIGFIMAMDIINGKYDHLPEIK